ncbi:ABC-type transport auxiliary lipoprotein family protein [Calditrichota bacterium]
MKLNRAIIVTIAILVLAGCTRHVLQTSYYLLEYQPRQNIKKLIVKKPLPYSVEVRSFKIPRSYDSIRIIARYSSHQIDYYRYSLWAVRPQIAIADLIMQHVNTYKLFKSCQREFLEERPQYEITGEIQQIERYDNEGFSAAHLKARIDFIDYETNELIVSHEFDRELKIPPENMTIFAKAVSDMISDETNQFLEKVVDHFIPPEDELQPQKP